MSCRATVRSTFALSLLILGLAAVPAAATGHDVCEGFDRKQRITKLGGRASFTRTPVTSPADLKAQLDEHRTEIETLMAERGLGHLTDALYAAVVSGDGLSERDLERGEVFEWMVYRKRKGPVSFGPMCVAARKTYDAYVIEVKEVEERPAEADCALKVSGGACVGDRFKVDTNGSSEGVKVDMKGPGSMDDAPSAPGTYRFTATAEVRGTKKVTTHTFVIPKICLNLAYKGMTSQEMAGAVDTCSESAEVTVPDCQASVDLSVDPTEVRRKESIQVDVSGTYDDVTVTFKDKDGDAAQAFDSGGNAISELKGSGAVSFKKAGTYTFEAEASRCNDLPQMCRQTATAGPVSVKVKPGWTARFFGVRVDPDEGPFLESSIRPDGVSERSHLHLDGGAGAGVEVEYHFNERIGLAASVIYAALGSELFFDLDDEWESDEDDISFLSFLVGPNFHLTPDKRVDVYLGLFAGLVDLGSTSYRVLGETQRRSFDADTAFGAQLGVDIPFGKGDWALNLAARYLDLTVELEGRGPEVGADPLIFQAGFSYKF